MKISKRTREQAALICALICAIAASAAFGFPYYNMIADDLGISLDDSFLLACNAWRSSVDRNGQKWTREVDAEAESILRTGWSPGDEP